MTVKSVRSPSLILSRSYVSNRQIYAKKNYNKWRLSQIEDVETSKYGSGSVGCGNSNVLQCHPKFCVIGSKPQDLVPLGLAKGFHNFTGLMIKELDLVVVTVWLLGVANQNI